MRRLSLTIVAVLALVASACGSDVSTVEAAETEQVELRTGREAILANHTEGKPYVLWYWGAH